VGVEGVTMIAGKCDFSFVRGKVRSGYTQLSNVTRPTLI
jgi:hypothetical protein